MKVKKIVGVAFAFVIFAALCVALFLFCGDKHSLLLGSESVKKISNITYETENGGGEITLPAVLKNLPERTLITLHTKLEPIDGSLLLKSVFAPTKLYLNDTLVYESGSPGSFPSFMNDPPTSLAIIPLPESDESISLRVEYLSPSQRSSIYLPEIYTGSEGKLLRMLIKNNGFSLLFSVILIFTGLSMAIVSLVFIRKMTGGKSFLWLGIFSLSAGIWILGECNLSPLLIPFPAVLYAMAYLGLFCVTIAFLRFCLVVLNYQNNKPITILVFVHQSFLISAIILQLTGIVDLMRMLYFFHIIGISSVVVFISHLLWEHFHHNNMIIKQFTPAIILLSASMVLEVIDYWLRLTGSVTVMFQFGLLFFIIALGVESGQYIHETMKSAAEMIRLEYEMATTKERERRLETENAALNKMSRLKTELMETISHEARTPLAVLSSYAGLVSMGLRNKGDNSQAISDLDKIVFEAQRVANLIDRMKMLTIHGCESAKRISLNLSEVASQTAELYRHILERRELTLTLSFEDDIPPVFGSPEELTQVLLNLLQNAKNATTHGGVSLSVKKIDDTISVSVEDTGKGVSPELMPQIFERGVSQSDSSGIGLPICKDIIEAHGGVIGIESEPGKWTRVTFSLPVYTDDECDE